MERDELLAKAQNEIQGMDLADLEAQKTGAYIAYFVGFVLIIASNVVEWFVLHRLNHASTMAICAMAFTAFLIKYIKLKKKHELLVALIYGAFAIAFLVLWILDLVG